jgi:hypothetical protein
LYVSSMTNMGVSLPRGRAGVKVKVTPRAGVQESGDAGDSEELADASARARDPQDAACSVNTVEGPNQFADSGRIDVGKLCKVKEDAPFAASEKSRNPPAQLRTDRRPESSLNLKDREGRAQLKRGGHKRLSVPDPANHRSRDPS